MSSYFFETKTCFFGDYVSVAFADDANFCTVNRVPFSDFNAAFVCVKNSGDRVLHISLSSGSQRKFRCNERHDYCLAIRRLLESYETVEFDNVPLIPKECLRNMFAELKHPNNGNSGAHHHNVPMAVRAIALAGIFTSQLATSRFTEAVCRYCIATGRIHSIRLDDIGEIRFTDRIIDCFVQSLASAKCALEYIAFCMDIEGDSATCGDRLLLGIARLLGANRCTQLKHLRLVGVDLTSESVLPFFDALLHSRVPLLTLDFAMNSLDQRCLDKAAEYVASDACALKSVNMGDHYYNVRLHLRVAFDPTLFCAAVSRNRTITDLGLSNLNCGKVGVVAMRDMLLENKTLRAVDYRDNPYCDGNDNTSMTREQSALCDIVLKNNTLTELDLEGGVGQHENDLLIDAIEEGNLTLTDICFGYEPHLKPEIQWRIMERNQAIVWEKVHAQLLGFCVALDLLNLRAYVLLDLFDWLPWMHLVPGWRKIAVILSVMNSCQRAQKRID